MEESSVPKKSFSKRILVAFLLLFILAIVLFMRIVNSPKDDEKAVPTPKNVHNGAIQLRIRDNRLSVGENETVFVDVLADSAQASITGYDILLTFDTAVVEYVSYENMNPRFQVMGSQRNKSVNVTGIKKLETTEQVLLQNTHLVTLQFRALKSGSPGFALAHTPGSTKDSNLINERNEDILGRVLLESFSVGQNLDLWRGSEVVLLGTNITVVLTQLEKSPPQCNDCMDIAMVTVKQADSTKVIEFKTGGFAGYMQVKQEAFGYNFELAELKADSVKLVYSKK